MAKSSIFQLTTSRRGRPFRDHVWFSAVKYFNSLPHAEVDDVLAQASSSANTFQLTTSRRGRRARFAVEKQKPVYFNSLPHAEVDQQSS